MRMSIVIGRWIAVPNRASSSLRAGRRLSTVGPIRERFDVDVAVVGAGPAGLATAIRLKQRRPEMSICILEKGAEVGSHTLSGNVFDPRALDELLPEWHSDQNAPFNTPVTMDRFYWMFSNNISMRVPFLPPFFRNKGNYNISLSRLVRWLNAIAIDMGIDVYPGFAASEILYSDSGSIVGIATKEVGIGRDGKQKSSFHEGVELRASQTVFAEGACGSLTERVIEKFELRSSSDPQTYSIGLKELWRVRPEYHEPGLVTHSVGWPLPNNVYGGSFSYHLNPDLVSLGFVVGLDYADPKTNPYELFQRWKHHPSISRVLEGGTPLEYGARVIATGGLQSVPTLSVPGGLLVGCAAGFMNVPRIKGTHTAMKSGMLAADSIADRLDRKEKIAQCNLTSYGEMLRSSWIWTELSSVRNIKPSFKKLGGLYGGMLYAALALVLMKGRAPWTFRNEKRDADYTKPLADIDSKPDEPFRPDNRISFDMLTNIQRAGVYHEEDQPVHLRLRQGVAEKFAVETSLGVYGAPEQYFCPAKVYEYVTNANGQKTLQINAANCVHCKTCDIKTPKRFIRWEVPEGGGGPSYSNM